MKEEMPLKWPEGWPRTRPQDQQARSSWKKTQAFYLDQLEIELKRMGTVACVVTLNRKGDRDPGVSVWFSRTKKDDFSWQDTLRMTNPYPTIDEVKDAYQILAKKYHPEGSEPDIELFHKITAARDGAIKWVNRKEGNTYDSAIACDTFNESRLNVAALWQSIKHIRGLERCGTSAIMERAFQGFAQIAEKAVTHVHAAAS